MDRRTAAADLKARNAALLERARTAVEEIALLRERAALSLAHSRDLLAEPGTRESVTRGLDWRRQRGR